MITNKLLISQSKKTFYICGTIIYLEIVNRHSAGDVGYLVAEQSTLVKIVKKSCGILKARKIILHLYMIMKITNTYTFPNGIWKYELENVAN